MSIIKNKKKFSCISFSFLNCAPYMFFFFFCKFAFWWHLRCIYVIQVNSKWTAKVESEKKLIIFNTKLVLLVISAAFVTINILLGRLKNDGINGTELPFFKSLNLSDSYEFVAVNEEMSYRSQVWYGVLQGSVLGLNILIDYRVQQPGFRK